jgi:hypothetical protein
MCDFFESGASQQRMEWLHYFLNHRGNSQLEVLIKEDLHVMEAACDCYAGGLTQKQECAWICQRLFSKIDAYARTISSREMKLSEKVCWPGCLDRPLQCSPEVPDFCPDDYSDLGGDLEEDVKRSYHERPFRQYANPLDPKDWSGEILGVWFQTPNPQMTKYYAEMIKKNMGSGVK